MNDPILGDAPKSDLCGDLDAVLGEAIEQALRPYVPRPAVRELRKEVIEYISDAVAAWPLDLAPADTQAHS